MQPYFNDYVLGFEIDICIFHKLTLKFDEEKIANPINTI